MPTSLSSTEHPSDRELVFSRTFSAPRELVWQAWTDPHHVVHWWGPKGFTNTIHEMNVQPGGVWRLTMHGPDGTDYPNRIEFITVDAPSRLVYHHGNDANPRMFHVTTEFIADGPRTRILTRIVFKTAAECAAAKKYAVDGHATSMDRLDVHLAAMPSSPPLFVASRVFDAPMEIVFRAFSDPSQLARWWGPNGFSSTFETFEFRAGGLWRFVMHGPDGANYPNENHFVEIAAPERIVFEHRQAGHNFRMTMLWSEHGGKTQLTWQMALESAADYEEKKAFIPGAIEQNFDRLAALLAG